MMQRMGRFSFRRGLGASFLLGALLWFSVIWKVLCLSSDGIALLQLKGSIVGDPGNLLQNWNAADDTPCSWNGVSCDPQTQRVTGLSIKGRSPCNDFGKSSMSSGDLSLCSGFVGSTSGAIRYQCFSEWLTAGGAGWNSSADKNSANSSKITGTLSPSIGNLLELRVLSLPFNELSGPIPKEIGNLKFLEVLELQGNSFAGRLPKELGQLRAIRVLNVGYNSLSFPVPNELSNCLNLEILDLSGNQLNGTVPKFLGRFSRLRVLSLSLNAFTGSIPVELATNCGSLEHLHLAGNLFTDSIPHQLGTCLQLRSLLLFSNFLEDNIPPELGNLLKLEVLDLSRNSLSGKLPAELAHAQRLSVLVLTNLIDMFPRNVTIDTSDEFSETDKGEYNYFEGQIPSVLFTHPQLQILWAPRATLNGPLLEDWSNCSSLRLLNLGENMLTGQIPRWLSQCQNLGFLDLSFSNLTGELPSNLAISSMLYFNVSGNSLVGSYPKVSASDCSNKQLLRPMSPGTSIADAFNPFIYASLLHCGKCATSSFQSLVAQDLPVIHDLSQNNFTGFIDSPLLCERNLEQYHISYALALNRNGFRGNIASALFNLCSKLQAFVLNLSGNKISGGIPQVFANCQSLQHFEAAGNQISGPLSQSVENLKSLMYLDLSRNHLSGSIPSQLGQLVNLQELLIGGNKFSGKIPKELGNLSSILVLDLSSNALTGGIPETLTELKHLNTLLLDNNFLSGEVPEEFSDLASLTVLNVSYNNFTGPLPKISKRMSCDDFAGNHFLHSCVSILSSQSQHPGPTDGILAYASPPMVNLDKKHKKFNSIEIASITSASAIVFVVIVLGAVYHCTKLRFPNYTRQRSGRKEVIIFNNIGVQITYEKICRATGNFTGANFIGHGGFGATYKAELVPGLLVAVKRLALGRFQGVKQFAAEIRTLGRVRHQNLVTLIGYHASKSEMFLIYNYLPGGNLENFLQERSRRRVDWYVLHKIAFDIAKALHYLHETCVPRVLHRDIKPSNILLDNNCNAYLSDFGLARLLGTSETHATTDVAGTFGYVAPEYAMTCRVSDKADVYSYGVVLMELLSDKKVLDPSFSSFGNGFNIVAWACMLLKNGRAREFFAPGLWDSGPHDDLIETLHLAVMCTVDTLSIRPTMKLVTQRLKHLQPPFTPP